MSNPIIPAICEERGDDWGIQNSLLSTRAYLTPDIPGGII